MNAPSKHSSKRPALILLSCLVSSTALLIGLAGPASAADIKVDAPQEVTVGSDIEVTAVVTDAGDSLAGFEMFLSYVGTVGGKSGWVELASGITDESGAVTFVYEQTAYQAERMRVEFVDSDGTTLTSPFEVAVLDSGQLHTSEAGVSLGIIGVWWLLVVIGIVWTMVLLAVSGIVKVGRSSDLEHGPVRALPRFAFGLVAFTALGMFIVILSRPTMHANLDPSADFDRRPPALVGTDYDYVGLSNDGEVANRVDSSVQALGVSEDCVGCGGFGASASPGLIQADNPDQAELDEEAHRAGEALYVTTNCVGCHGIDARGAIVGPALVSVDDPNGISLSAFTEEIREGPKDMPVYSETRLTDDEIGLIHEYLFGPSGS